MPRSFFQVILLADREGLRSQEVLCMSLHSRPFLIQAAADTEHLRHIWPPPESVWGDRSYFFVDQTNPVANEADQRRFAIIYIINQ